MRKTTNYIKEILAFNDSLQINLDLSTGQMMLWYQLMFINNKTRWMD
ncbi:hypothetical protein FRFR103141_02360 [Fructilactobacillus fructivorans]